MAKRETVQTIDDLDGTVLDGVDLETVSWGVEGRRLEIDLSRANANGMREHLAGYRAASRQITQSGRPYRRTTVAPTGRAATQIRRWAIENGFTVNRMGAIPTEVREAYNAAHRG